MKPNTIFLTLLFVIIETISLNAQEVAANNTYLNPKKGIYKNFEEFRNNAPSIELKHEVLRKQKSTGGIIKKQETTFYHLNISKEEAKKNGRVYGFSDGKNIYINELNPKLKPNVLFMRIGFIGEYGVFEYETFDGVNSLPSRNMVIDMSTGRLKIVSKKTLIRFAKDTNLIAINTDLHKTTSASAK